jgi:hypothetical protein
MNSKTKCYKAESVRGGSPTKRTLDLQLDVNTRDPRNEVAKMFALARSAGKELNVTFGLPTA